MGKTCDITLEERAAILALSEAGMRQVDIAAQVGRSQAVVSRSLRNDGSKRGNCGRRRITNARDDRKLGRIVKNRRFANCAEISQEWNESGVQVSRSTTFRRLQKMGYNSRVPVTKPLLSRRQRQKRLQWAREHQNWDVEQWSKILFSDESRFCISFGNQGNRVWRRSGEQNRPSCVKQSVKFPQSVMVWASMSSAGVGPICFLRSTVNAAVYQEVLEHFLIPSVEKLYGNEGFTFQHDLAPAHNANSTKTWLADHGIRVLTWPANSPDLNPIENLWGIVKRRLRQHRCSNLGDLKCAIREVWESVTPDDCARLVESMPARIQAVIIGKGAATKY